MFALKTTAVAVEHRVFLDKNMSARTHKTYPKHEKANDCVTAAFARPQQGASQPINRSRDQDC